jgi:antitoxin (DNA-binding transcriptional repressor) of toxin-antitoxin stability system
MQKISLNEAKDDLSTWIDRAFSGEVIRIEDEGKIVQLQPIAMADAESKATALAAFNNLQAISRLSKEDADRYCQEIRRERDAYRNE